MNISGDEGFFYASRLCAGCESHCFHFAQCILFPEKNTFSERSRLKAEKSYEWFSNCFNRYCSALQDICCMEDGLQKNGGSTQRQRHLPTHMRMGRIMYRHQNLPYFHISFHPLQEQDLSPDRSWHPCLAGYRFCCG